MLEVSEWKEKEEEEKKIVVHFDVVNENDKAVMVGGVVVFQGLGSRAMLWRRLTVNSLKIHVSLLRVHYCNFNE